MTDYGYQITSGTTEVSNADGDNPVITAPGAGKTLRLLRAVISVTVAAVGGGGEVALEDGVGVTQVFEADADALGVYTLDFGDHGYPFTANTAISLVVGGAGTTQATARCTAIAKVVG